MIRNSLRNLIGKYKLNSNEFTDILVSLPNITLRPEQLNLKQLIELSDALYLQLPLSKKSTLISGLG